MDLHGAFHVYDTTLRDGAQQEGLNLSVADKLAIARQLDGLGVGYIEGGWPGANPKDTEFFRRAAEELDLRHARLAAFGATRRAGVRAADDPLVAALRDSGAGVVTLVAKSHDRHVELALRTTLEENLAMVRDTVTHLREEGQTVFLDAEHFFDGYRANRAYALEVLRTAAEAGAEVVALCDTNGGMLPDWVSDVVLDVIETTGTRVGIHAHNDSGCAVANSLAAVAAGASHVQGCINGYGERTGNADLVTVVANLETKLDRSVLPEGLLREATRIAHAVAEVTNVPPASRQPYVGTSAFAHKAGLHASAIKVDPDLYQHLDPLVVGNDMRLLVSDMAGRASIELKGRELGYDLSDDRELVTRVTDRVKAMEQRGYTFEAADASFELLLAEEVEGARPSYFDVESWRVITETRTDGEAISEATVKLRAPGAELARRQEEASRLRGLGSDAPADERPVSKPVAEGVRYVVTGEGNGPVNALDAALREAIGQAFPEVAKFELIDYKVRILDPSLPGGHGTDAITRVLIETSDGESSWVTVGVGANVIEASWGALVDGLTFGLRRHHR
ncbi:citramalate synthase [Nocardioides sp. J2M5]|uniref:citramalate synthase n=1 Tax=Nocardioides palaemonis TaxID=2829810 RepID=UPI001BAC0BEC|nr:citramalate synthase [Nocardioides palaemonis]MBS2937338.1 citramalate synthase [Nocardioides palaemonis]